MYPATDVMMTNTTCANSVCKSDNPARGGKNKVNLWAAGDNLKDEVYTSNLKILDSHYSSLVHLKMVVSPGRPAAGYSQYLKSLNSVLGLLKMNYN